MGKLDNKIALVTGASTGIGCAVAKLFADEGATVVLTSHTSIEDGEKTRRDIEAKGGNAVYFSADLSVQDGVDKLFNFICGKYGKLDILVNNAGRTYNIPFEDLSAGTFDRDLNVNLKSTFMCSIAAHKIMDEGWIINTASIRGIPEASRPGIVGYCAAKSAIISLTKAMAMQLSPKIYINAVAPGFVYTNYMNTVTEEMKKQWLSQIPINRFIMPEEIAEVYLMLATTHIFTGSVISPDGGYTLLNR